MKETLAEKMEAQLSERLEPAFESIIRSKQNNIPQRTAIKSALVILIGCISALYLANPTMGFVEVAPDNLPVIGNIDEAAVTLILISCFAYFGIDVRPFIASMKARTEEQERKK